MSYSILNCRRFILPVLFVVTVSAVPIRPCIPCAVYCSVANHPDLTGPSCWSCQCEPAGDSSYKPSNAMCDDEYCKLKCSGRGNNVDGCPNCRCAAIVRRIHPS